MSKAPEVKKAPAPHNQFRSLLNEFINKAIDRKVPLEEIQSALHSETDIVDLKFKALVDAAK